MQQGDASDEATIEGLVKRAMQEEGRLDVFYANVRTAHLSQDVTSSLAARRELRRWRPSTKLPQNNS